MEPISPWNSPDAPIHYIDVSSVSNKTFTIEGTQTLLGRDAPSRARRSVRVGDVLFATIRPTLQRIATVPPELDGQVCSTGYSVLRPKAGTVTARFLFHFLFSEAFSDAMRSLQKGASYPAVTDAEVRAQSIPVPPLPEQERIVRILDEALAAVDQARKHIGASLAAVDALFASHLGSTYESSASRYPLAELRSLASSITDGDHMPPPKSASGIPFVTISCIDKEMRKLDLTRAFAVPVEYYDNISEHRRPRQGDILYTVTGSFGIPVVVPGDQEFCFQRHIALIRPLPSVDAGWLQYMLLSPQVYKQADASATGTAQRTVGLRSLRAFSLPVPDLDEQRNQAASWLDLDQHCVRMKESLRAKRTASDSLAKALRHRAFSGLL